MRNDNERHIATLAFVNEYLPELSLSDGVKHGADLISNDDCWTRKQCAGYADTLELSSTQLVRITRKPRSFNAARLHRIGGSKLIDGCDVRASLHKYVWMRTYGSSACSGC